MKLIGTIAYVTVAVLVVLFAVGNRQMVTVSFEPLLPAYEMPLFVVVVLGVGLGALLILPGALLKRWRLTRRASKAEAHVLALQEEIAELTAEHDRLKFIAGEKAERIDAAQRPGGPMDEPVSELLPHVRR